jgi:hypothetical protein
MTPRQFDSTKTRVTPVFDALLVQPPGWVARLLDLAASPGDRPHPWRDQDLSVVDHGWGTHERALLPPITLLEWLVRNVTLSEGATLTGDVDTVKARQRLLARDRDTIDAALKLLRERRLPRTWYVFEGPTCPDVFIDTPDALIVVEGKRTEAGPTTCTEWMPARHQMLRHMDAAWEIRGDRAVYGFFIVEADPHSQSTVAPMKWREAACATVSPAALDGSLPHRSPEERRGIAKGFIGVTTWQAIVAEFGLSPSVLPDRAS